MRNVTQALGYEESPNYLRVDYLEDRPFSGYRHVYRNAREHCGLQGVYLLSDQRRSHSSELPVVYYCKAENETAAGKIHQRIWNQGVVPFALVETPGTLRLYSGFRFDPTAADDLERGILAVATTFNEIADRLGALSAQAIDSGTVWDRWGQELDLRGRVDPSLLDELEKLEAELRQRELDRETAHALIGKFVYLKFLRDRRILSDRKLAKWRLTANSVFSHRATLRAFRELNARLDSWLNGSVFPLPEGAIRAEHLQLVAGVFAGGTAGGQLPLDLRIYDFSLIPIETLSVIYEQFLHAAEDGKPSRGRRAGAYYTPIHLVNYILAELASRRPLEEGMRVLDPACGSAAFLVQCYRALIEGKVAKQGRVRPSELRALLTRHIFGVDSDPEACQVAEMSLILTLLDYTTPPDLESNPQFKLPALRGNNIFCADFFDPDSEWARKRARLKVDWLVGNPPWREAKRGREENRHVLRWIRRNAERCPIGGNQIAEAFVWHSLSLLDKGASAALLLPAMTLFKMESKGFRARLFEAVRVWSVANFANLAYVLFSGRSQAPAAALFFEPRPSSTPPGVSESILTFAPFLANQRVGRAKRTRRGKETWHVIVNGAELREVRSVDVVDGDARHWKEAMWGSFRDARLLSRIAHDFPTLAEFADANDLNGPHQGIELRESGSGEATEVIPRLAGRLRVDFSKLKHCGRIFAFPPDALSSIPIELSNVRQGRGKLPLLVSQPPHIIIDVGRRFAIYSEEFIAVPARQIGINGSKKQALLLKALSLLLSSDFCRYQQFFETPQWGVSVSVATLSALRTLPTPLDKLTDDELHEWAAIWDGLASEFPPGVVPSKEILREVDERVYRLIGLSESERILVEDFVSWNMQVIKGKVPPQVVAPPDDRAIVAYLTLLKSELDEFVGMDAGLRHDLHAVRGKDSAMFAVRLVRGSGRSPSVLPAGEETATALEETREHLLRHHSQWLYFERSLKIYQDGTMYVFKPLEAIHWTRRQAILDAGEIVAETMGSQEA